jgi:hypothetical protein
VDVDRVQPSENLHATFSPVIATLDHHERTASAHPLSIGVRLIIRNAKVYERIHEVGSLVCRVPLDG